MFCTNCGNPVADDAKFCANCGNALTPPAAPAADPTPAPQPASAPLELEEDDGKAVYAEHIAEPAADNTEFYSQYTPPVTPQPAAKKKGGKTALLMIATLVLLAIAGIALLFGGGNGEDSGSIHDIVAELDALLADSFEDYTIEYDEESDCIMIATWSDGVAEATQYVSSNSELKASWQELRANMNTMSDTAKDYVDACGYEDTSVIVSLLNDLNLDNVLLLCIDGQVFYDCTEE